MSSDEVLKRLSDMGKASLLPFIEFTEDGHVYFDFSDPEAKHYIHLIKRIKSSRSRKITEGKNDKDPEAWEYERAEVELHDAFSALVQVGKHHKLFGEKEPNFNIDLSTLTLKQLQRLRDGEDVISILANPS